MKHALGFLEIQVFCIKEILMGKKKKKLFSLALIEEMTEFFLHV